MDHNLDDALNLESAIGVDFEHSEDSSTVVHEGGISLDTSGHEQDIPMEFEHIEEQPMLMDTGSEEIIDFMGDQFALQEYEVPDGQVSNLTTTVEANNQMIGSTQADGLLDMQFEPQTITVTASEVTNAPRIATTEFVSIIKPAAPSLRAIAPKKETLVLTKAPLPRQIAIAPKPPANIQKLKPMSFGSGKQLAIAPKPVALLANKSVLVKKMPEISKGSVLAQIGKQLVMVPASGGQKIKLVTSGPGVPSVRLLGTADADQTQLISQNLSGKQSKPLMAKVIVQGTGGGSAALPKILPASSAGGAAPAPLIAMQKKTVPISIGHNKVLVTSPTTSGIKFQKKQQLIAIKSPKAKMLPATSQGGTTTTKKVIISANQPQNVMLKTTGQSKTGHVVKAVGPRTQVHQINVPGKGIQYIRLVTNPSPKTPTKPQGTSAATKTFFLADNKGALLRLAGDKPPSSQPPPLLVTSVSSSNKPSVKPQQKLVRIAPIPAKSAQTTMQQTRVGQSLLAPLSPMPMAEAQAKLINDMSDLLGGDHVSVTQEVEEPEGKPDVHSLRALVEETQEEYVITEEPQDSKATLQALIADAVGSDAESQDGMDNSAMSNTVMENTVMHNIVLENTAMNNSMMDSSMMDNSSMDNSGMTNDYDRRRSSMGDDSNSIDRSEMRSDHPLIVVPSIPSYMKPDMLSGEHADYEGSNHNMNNMVTVELDPFNTYSAPNIQQVVDPDVVPGGMRPRRACNCTKSQCLKLYCDCFANGEFCNRCNCNNCHNNLENEELRQKAIRGCLDRNPNAFRPKIGKSKMGGPEIIRRHNKGCNCKRSGCLKNYCECYEAKIACSMICKCVGCRNVEETLERTRRREPGAEPRDYPRLLPPQPAKQPCSFMTAEVIEAVCQCLLAAAVEADDAAGERDPTRDVIDEFARCLQDIISASHHAAPLTTLSEQQS